MNIYEEIVKAIVGVPLICAGEYAFSSLGMVKYFTELIQAWTLLTIFKQRINTKHIMLHFNPLATDLHSTDVSPRSNNVFIPTKERAICEYILFREYFDEGILIEGLQDYLWDYTDMSKLYKEAQYFAVPKEEITYWLKEAEEDLK